MNIENCLKILNEENTTLKKQKAMNDIRLYVKKLKEQNHIYVLAGNAVALELHIKDRYIPKEKIQDKIDELKETVKECANSEEYRHEIPLYKHDIGVLEELLKGESEV